MSSNQRSGQRNCALKRLDSVRRCRAKPWTLTDEHREAQGYPENRDDFARSLDYLKALDVGLWLGAHPGQNDTFGKHERLKNGEKPNPFIDPDGWQQFIANIEASFRKVCEG